MSIASPPSSGETLTNISFDLEKYRRARLRLEGLERWLAVGDRPSLSGDDQDDIDLHAKVIDDIKSLRRRCDMARQASWAAMPPPPEDTHLSVAPSGISGAGLGLFANIDMPIGTSVCRLVRNSKCSIFMIYFFCFPSE